MAKEKDEMVKVETLTDIGLRGREGFIAKGEECEVTFHEFATHPESYALLKEPSAKFSERVGEMQETEGVPEKSSLAESNTLNIRGTTAVAPDYETDPVKYDEHVIELSKKGKGGKK